MLGWGNAGTTETIIFKRWNNHESKGKLRAASLILTSKFKKINFHKKQDKWRGIIFVSEKKLKKSPNVILQGRA